MMNLDEAIKHAEEMAKLNEAECFECAEEHRQLAEWLEELKERREHEPKHGEWIWKKDEDSLRTYDLLCSECGCKIFTCENYDNVEQAKKVVDDRIREGKTLFPFCPNCGASIRVKDELNRVNKELNSEIEYKAKVKELEDAIAKCEKAEKEFKREMPAKKLSDITTRVTDIFMHSEFYDCTLCGGEKDCLECKKEHTVYELLDVIASLHNELYKEVTGKYYDYMYHWANLGYGGTPDDGLFKGGDEE